MDLSARSAEISSQPRFGVQIPTVQESVRHVRFFIQNRSYLNTKKMTHLAFHLICTSDPIVPVHGNVIKIFVLSLSRTHTHSQQDTKPDPERVGGFFES